MQTLYIKERSLPTAWERAVLETWNAGARFRTEYDKPGDPESRDVCAMIHVTEPLSEPRIHKAFPGGLDDLEIYRAEVLHGVHDHWIAPEEGKWEYTYHERLFEYRVPGLPQPIDQIEAVIAKLAEAPHSRRAQAVTWQAWNDTGIHDPACLQRMWFRVEQGRLNLVVHMRSNDAFKAAFMNMFAFTELQRTVAARLGVDVGDYVHGADSFHIYGSYFGEFEGFLRSVESRPDRYFTTEFALPMFLDGAERLLAERDLPPAKRAIVEARKTELQKLLA
ncbi:MAG: hypothetical protein GXY74_03580 [Phycisphaerae bacterium]|nr:hypothetical protein [Phycisphaerae bacterium]